MVKSQVSVVDRLTKDAHTRIEKQYKAGEKQLEELSAQYTFHPQISQKENSSQLSNDFVTRQEEFIRKAQEKADLKRAEENNDYTFKPTINMTSEILQEKR
jgi:hypothetical protein